ncbi:hypothetical protein Clow_00678 [Corynebacterium lowii]|uniref:Uncharacterized protein n=2 Tax=Corynebacterium lowii TaxID=1544413 RepID=A0A0N8W0T8_9CORY|nr:hypothetical protein Clow_00678 [Corynebacterium lowii]
MILMDYPSVFLSILLVCALPAAMAAALIAFYRVAEHKNPERWDTSTGPQWWAVLLLALLSGVIWMIAWYSWGGGAARNSYPLWQVLGSVACVVAGTVGLGFWARWRLSGPLSAAVGTMIGVCLAFGFGEVAQDSTGQSAAGLLLLAAGGGLGLFLVSLAVTALRVHGVPAPSSTE